MRAARTVAPGIIEIADIIAPEPDGSSVLLRVESVGLCGSDLALFNGTHPYSHFPIILGHEFAGVVEDTGSRADLARGDRVAVEPLNPCGACYACRRGRVNCCTRLQVVGVHAPGGLSELVAVRPDAVFPVGTMPARRAVLVEPMSIGLQGVVRADIQPGEYVTVLGAGPIGLAVLVAAREAGAHVMLTDIRPARLRLARDLGAERVVDSTVDDLGGAVRRWTDGDGAAVVFDATGIPEVVRSAFDLVAASGRIVLIGISTQEVSVPINEYIRKELTVLGSRNNAGLFGRSVELVARHAEQLDALVTHIFPLGDVQEAFAMARAQPDDVGKIVIDL